MLHRADGLLTRRKKYAPQGKNSGVVFYMVIKTVNLALVCGVTSKIPAGSLPEFAFAGRSNVGKSTLINGLMNRKSLARVSAQPGKTQTINYYEINGAFHLVDLPGYGYARANLKVKEQWGKMIERYLRTSTQLRAVFLLLDIRHEPSVLDVQMFDWILQAGFTPVIIATKSDKIKRSQLQKQLGLLRRTLKEESSVLGKKSRRKENTAGKVPEKAQEEKIPVSEGMPAEKGQAAAELQDHAAGKAPEEGAPAPSGLPVEKDQAAAELQNHTAGKMPEQNSSSLIRIIPWSGQTKEGRDEIYAVLEGLLSEDT